MTGWRERKSKLVQWIRDLAQYSTCVIFFIFWGVSLLIWASRLFFYDSVHIDNDSARYLLSALVQSQAAIVAIVVTLTLIAIQLVASSYSLRTIDIFKKSPLWWFLTCYGMSIFYGLFVLGLIQKDVPPSEFIVLHSISLEFCIYIAYWFGFVTFAMLIIYMGKIFNFLESSNIIEILSDRITKENVVKFIESEEKQKEDQTQLTIDDPVQPIMDIIYSSVMKYDIATTRIGLKAVTNRVIEIIDSDSQEEISTWFCDHLERVGTLTVNKMDEESTAEAIKNLGSFGKSAAERRLKGAALKAVKSLNKVGKPAAESGFKKAGWRAAESLGQVGKTAAENGLGGAAASAAMDLVFFGRLETRQGNKEIAKRVIWFLEKIGTIAAEKGKELEPVAWQSAESLVLVGMHAVDHGLKNVAKQAAWSLRMLTNSSEEIVKTVIQRLEQEHQGYFAFERFKDLYEHEPKELQNPH